jgi:hypothetical protein
MLNSRECERLTVQASFSPIVTPRRLHNGWGQSGGFHTCTVQKLYLRQQFILFPFAVICACVLLDRSGGAVRNELLRALLATAIVLLAIGVSSTSFYQFPKVSTQVGTTHANRFREVFPSPSATYVDQYNLIMFFIHYHDWKWVLMGYPLHSGSPSILWSVSGRFVVPVGLDGDGLLHEPVEELAAAA